MSGNGFATRLWASKPRKRLTGAISRVVELASRAIPFNVLLSATGVGPVIVYYHAVSDTPLPHITPLYRHRTVREFEADLDFLLRFLPPLSLDEVLAAAGGERIRRGVFVTFDDGLREVLEQAEPVLRRKGVPAALFVNSAFLDNADLFYRFKAALLISASVKASAGVYAECIKTLERSGIRGQSVESGLLAVSYAQRRVLDDVAPLLDVDFAAYLREHRPYLTRAELLDMQARGWGIGAHSMDHPRYSEIPLDEQLRQTCESMSAVGEAMSSQCQIFAFPFTSEGVGDDFYLAVREQYPLCALFGTSGWFHNPERHLLNRFSLEGEKPAATVFVPQSLGLTSARHLLGRRQKTWGARSG